MSVIPDPSAVRAFVEANALVDRCKIERPVNRGERHLNRTTMQMQGPPAEEVYGSDAEPGVCLLTPLPTQAERVTEGDRESSRGRWRCRIPVDADLPQEGDKVTMIASQDPAMAGREFRVLEAKVRSLGVTRMLFLGDWEGTTVR